MDSTKFISDATGLIKDATDSIATIKDEASATVALPKLQDITGKLGALQSSWPSFPSLFRILSAMPFAR